ncbi:hypothetical protein M3J09_003182 [Ascochyta lentis]
MIMRIYNSGYFSKVCIPFYPTLQSCKTTPSKITAYMQSVFRLSNHHLFPRPADGSGDGAEESRRCVSHGLISFLAPTTKGNRFTG